MPPENEWLASLPEADRALATERKWAGPADVVKAYRENAAAARPWTDGFDASDLELVAGKKWEKPGDLLAGYKAAQHFIGAPADELLRVPKSGLSPEDLKPIFERIGVPKDPAAYKFDDVKLPDEMKPFVGKFTAEVAREAGLTQHGAKAVVEWFLRTNAAEAEAAEKRFVEEQGKAKTVLTAEWGQAAPAKLQAAETFAKAMGLDDETVSLLEGAKGPEWVLRTFSALGEKLGEYKLVEGEGQLEGGLTKAAAQAKVNELRADPAFMDRKHPRHAQVLAEIDKLSTLIHGADPAIAGSISL